MLGFLYPPGFLSWGCNAADKGQMTGRKMHTVPFQWEGSLLSRAEAMPLRKRDWALRRWKALTEKSVCVSLGRGPGGRGAMTLPPFWGPVFRQTRGLSRHLLISQCLQLRRQAKQKVLESCVLGSPFTMKQGPRS